MSQFMLKAGTVVKHGTSSAHLNSILQDGLVARHSRHTLRTQSEKYPKHDGVYVGELSAYFGALAAHGPLVKEFAQSLPNLAAIATDFYRLAGAARGKHDVSLTPYSVPVVLNIKLPIDIALVGDEDYFNLDTESRTDAQVWDKWRAGTIMQTIPPSWIESFEFPTLITVEQIPDTNVTSQLDNDMALFSFGALSVGEKIEAANFDKHRQSELSNKMIFSQAAIDLFLNDPKHSDAENRFVNMCVQQAYFNQHCDALEFKALVF